LHGVAERNFCAFPCAVVHRWVQSIYFTFAFSFIFQLLLAHCQRMRTPLSCPGASVPMALIVRVFSQRSRTAMASLPGPFFRRQTKSCALHPSRRNSSATNRSVLAKPDDTWRRDIGSTFCAASRQGIGRTERKSRAGIKNIWF